MKKYAFVLLFSYAFIGTVYSAETTLDTSVSTTVSETTTSVTAEESVAVEPAAVEPAPAPAVAVTTESAVAVDTTGENLEFISGEVSSLDEAAKTVTVKLYGETENTPGEKSITVSVDASTDITDGEKDRDLKSLTAGTEVDVEYDPATSKSTYIFVY